MLLQYMYNGEINVLKEDLGPLIETARCLQVALSNTLEKLAQICENHRLNFACYFNQGNLRRLLFTLLNKNVAYC